MSNTSVNTDYFSTFFTLTLVSGVDIQGNTSVLSLIIYIKHVYSLNIPDVILHVKMSVPHFWHLCDYTSKQSWIILLGLTLMWLHKSFTLLTPTLMWLH